MSVRKIHPFKPLHSVAATFFWAICWKEIVRQSSWRNAVTTPVEGQERRRTEKGAQPCPWIPGYLSRCWVTKKQRKPTLLGCGKDHKSKSSPVVATYSAIIRRSSVCRVLFEKEKIEICTSSVSLLLNVRCKFFKNVAFSSCFWIEMLMTPPPLLPSSPCFFSAKISLRCPSGSCWRNHCAGVKKKDAAACNEVRCKRTYTQCRRYSLVSPCKVIFVVQFDPIARNVGDSTAMHVKLFMMSKQQERARQKQTKVNECWTFWAIK